MNICPLNYRCWLRHWCKNNQRTKGHFTLPEFPFFLQKISCPKLPNFHSNFLAQYTNYTYISHMIITKHLHFNNSIYFFSFVRGRNPSLFCNLIGCSSGRNFTISDHGPKVIFYDDKSGCKSKFQN